MNELLEGKIIESIPAIREKTNVLHFSTGLDSICCFLRLMELGIEPILIYDYFLPNIPFVDSYIKYFEDKFNTHIYEAPSDFCIKWIDNALFQLPIKARESFRNRTTDIGFYKQTNDKRRKDIVKALGVKKEDIIFHQGIKYTDGFMRYKNLTTNGVRTKDNKFFPVASYTLSDECELLKKYDVRLPIEYRWQMMSFEWVTSRNILFIKKDCPKSYEYICSIFPLVKAYEYRDRYIVTEPIFKGLYTHRNNLFKDMIIDYKE